MTRVLTRVIMCALLLKYDYLLWAFGRSADISLQLWSIDFMGGYIDFSGVVITDVILWLYETYEDK